MRIIKVFMFIILFQSFLYAECTLKMGVFPYTNPQKIANDYSYIANNISKYTGCQVLVHSAKDHDDYMLKAKGMEYDILVPCTSCFVALIKNNVKLEVLATGHPSFKGAVIVRSDSDITDIKQIKGKKVAAVGKYSFGGFTFLKLKLATMGIDIEKENTVVFLGSTDNIIMSVLNGKVDVGITRLDVLDEQIYRDARKQLKIIYESSPIPHFPFAVPSTMNSELKSKILKALIEYTPPTDGCRLGFTKIVKSSNEEYLKFAKEYNLK
ncbi:MAG: PhnD/SsuA/transferrin family substrate-binding protein [Calditerrivibrio sp.]|nr:PhnD/SsuA/transferrin family substrate-binding protein [Calditerrivibrio sp.]